MGRRASWVTVQGVGHEQDTNITTTIIIQGHSVRFSHAVIANALQPHESQHARPPCPSPSPGVHSNSHPLSR